MNNKSIDVKDFKGTYTAIITPMKKDGSLDHQKLEELIDDQIEAGVDGILACGTTGQSATLKHREHIMLAQYIYEYIDNKVKFMVSAGSNSTEEAIYLTNEIEKRIGPTTFLHVTGYYNNPPQEGLFLHYSAISENLKENESNIVLYNVPGRTASNLEADTVIKLAKNEKIIGIKEASGKLEQIEKIIQNTDSNKFKVLSGEDHLVAPIIKMGGYGVISASANIAPRYFSNIVNAALDKDYELADEMQEKILPLVKAVFKAKNPIPLAHIFNTEVRLPLCKLPRIENEVIDTINQYHFKNLGIDVTKYWDYR
jgi:4-hydroxy-tetrahydrodipicolinate synthase